MTVTSQLNVTMPCGAYVIFNPDGQVLAYHVPKPKMRLGKVERRTLSLLWRQPLTGALTAKIQDASRKPSTESLQGRQST